ncbi:MAG: hypothetical protein GX938_02015, partial [Spirochaetales bacterium]|nr:hypothetical protein [Spirochaetales bacterium]
TDGICIGSGAKIAFLPDGKFLLASDTHKTLQVCRIVRDSVEVVHTYSTADQFNVNGVTDIFVDLLTYRVAISNSVNPKLVFYQYDLTSSSLIKILEKENNYGNEEWGTGTFPYLHHLSIDRSAGVIFGLHPNKEVVASANFYAYTAAEAHNPYYYEPFFGDEIPYDAMDFSPSGEYAALSKTAKSELRLYQKFPFGVEFFSEIEIHTGPETPYLTGIKEVRFLDDSNLIYATNKDVGRFQRTGANQWAQREVFTSGIGGLGTMNQISLMRRASGGTRLFVLCSGSRNLHIFTFTTSGGLENLGTTELGSLTPHSMDVSPKGDHVVVTSTNSASLQLYKIPE